MNKPSTAELATALESMTISIEVTSNGLDAYDLLDEIRAATAKGPARPCLEDFAGTLEETIDQAFWDAAE